MGWAAVVLFGAGVAVVLFWMIDPEGMETRFQQYGNGASVLGLLFGLSALAFTVWTVVETQKIEEEARKREGEAIQKANEEIEQARQAILAAEKRTAAVVRSLALERLSELCDRVWGLLTESQKEIFAAKNWRVAVTSLSEARLLCMRIADFPDVEEPDRQLIGNTVHDLDSTIRVVGTTRFKEPEPASEGTPNETPKAAVGQEASSDDLVRPLQVLMHAVTRIASRVEQARRYPNR